MRRRAAQVIAPEQTRNVRTSCWRVDRLGCASHPREAAARTLLVPQSVRLRRAGRAAALRRAGAHRRESVQVRKRRPPALRCTSACTQQRTGHARQAGAARPRLSGARLQALARALVPRAPGRLVARRRAEARGVAAGAQLRLQAGLRRAGQVAAPARARRAGESGPRCARERAMRPAGAGAHPDHQQPTGRSAGVARRRSSRVACDGPSAARPGATSASKRAMAAAMAASRRCKTVLLGSDSAGSPSCRAACRRARTASAGQRLPAEVGPGAAGRARTTSGECSPAARSTPSMQRRAWAAARSRSGASCASTKRCASRTAAPSAPPRASAAASARDAPACLATPSTSANVTSFSAPIIHRPYGLIVSRLAAAPLPVACTPGGGPPARGAAHALTTACAAESSGPGQRSRGKRCLGGALRGRHVLAFKRARARASRILRSTPPHAGAPLTLSGGVSRARTALGQRAQRVHDKGHQARARRHDRLAPLGPAARRELADGDLRSRAPGRRTGAARSAAGRRRRAGARAPASWKKTPTRRRCRPRRAAGGPARARSRAAGAAAAAAAPPRTAAAPPAARSRPPAAPRPSSAGRARTRRACPAAPRAPRRGHALVRRTSGAAAAAGLQRAARRTRSPARQAAPGARAIASSLASVASSGRAADGAAAPAPAASSRSTACFTACAQAAAPRVRGRPARSPGAATAPAAVQRRHARPPRRSAAAAQLSELGNGDQVTPRARLARRHAGVLLRRDAQRVWRAPQRGPHRRQRGRQQALAPLGVLLGCARADLRARQAALRRPHAVGRPSRSHRRRLCTQALGRGACAARQSSTGSLWPWGHTGGGGHAPLAWMQGHRPGRTRCAQGGRQRTRSSSVPCSRCGSVLPSDASRALASRAPCAPAGPALLGIAQATRPWRLPASAASQGESATRGAARRASACACTHGRQAGGRHGDGLAGRHGCHLALAGAACAPAPRARAPGRQRAARPTAAWRTGCACRIRAPRRARARTAPWSSAARPARWRPRTRARPGRAAGLRRAAPP